MPPNISLSIGKADGGRRDLHLLFRGSVRELRTGSIGRLLRAVPLQLEGYTPVPTGAVRMSVRALVAADHAVLVDRRFDEHLERAEGRLVRLGYRRLDAAFAEVDAATGELVLDPPSLRFEEEAAAALDREDPPGDREVHPLEGRLPVRSLVALDPSYRLDHPASLSEQLMAMGPLVADRHRTVDVAGLRLMADWLTQGIVEPRHHVTAHDLITLMATSRTRL